MMKKDHLFA